MATPREHRQLLNLLYSQDIVHSRIFGAMSKELAFVLRKYKNPSTGNVWNRNKALEKEVDKILIKYQKIIFNSVTSYNSTAWNLSNKHNDSLVESYIKGVDLTRSQKTPLLSRNNQALSSFLTRKTNGLNLSDRVWKLTESSKSQIETLLAEGLASGRSAAKLTGDIKSYLSQPDRRFRRIRNPDTGKLMISEPGKNYNPGRGVYRSSYKNALRLARNEINIAYRTADIERRKNLPFVIGVKVNLSPAHPQYDICDELQGDYPKNFVFTGWHPNCLCFTTSKLLSRKEFIGHLNGRGIPQSKIVTTIPEQASNYIQDNANKIKSLSSKPYFIQDNFKNTKEGFALNLK